MRKKEISREMILEASISCAAQNGLENVTTGKVAAALAISEGTIFNNFPNKRALLVECLYHIDRNIDAVLHAVPFQGLSVEKNVRAMWNSYMAYFLAHGDHARYYRQFRHCAYYDNDVIQGQGNSFSFFSRFLEKNIALFGIRTDIVWVFVIETTLNFAVRVVSHELPGGPTELEQMYRLLFGGVTSILNKGTLVWPDLDAEEETGQKGQERSPENETGGHNHA